MDNKPKNDSLSINRFKDRATGELVDPATLSDQDHKEFVLAVLMKTVIETLEMAVQNDRIFNRARYEVMAAFHQAKDKFKLR